MTIIHGSELKAPEKEQSFSGGYGDGVSAVAFVFAGIADILQAQMGEFALHKLPALLQEQEAVTEKMNALSKEELPTDTPNNWFENLVNKVFPGSSTETIENEEMIRYQAEVQLTDNQAETLGQQVSQGVTLSFKLPASQEKAVAQEGSNVMHLFQAMGRTRV